ncbi:hypothetical protein J8L98_15320 [Pseudoalteromonas sp. MMG013]|uniref:hypothetical protein n=1 Tax=Pseudoalteromonas sp. MMG013 TaxID=2822687 RepID=UPI001B377894|nr:hypothetical protein [Pseudoalteromonas sp. MMG013]MBQ4863055.1 hypothetical protein [Pseudoalteromonas sp. MMG013]
MNELIFALLNQESQQAKYDQKKLRALTLAWSRYGYHGNVIEHNNIDQLLTEAAHTSAHYCLIQHVGHVIDEQWYLSHWRQEGFYQGIQRIISGPNFLVAGEPIITEHDTCGLNTDCLLVNLACYRQLAHPKFGDTEAKNHCITHHAGWHFIQASFEHNLPLIRFGESINNCRFDLAKESQNNQFGQLIGLPVDKIDDTKGLSRAQTEFIQRIKKQLNNAQKGAFLFNIESYQDLVQTKNNPLDAVFSVAAGFKPYRILFTQGFHENTHVVLFDYSLKALEIRRYIIEHWDGNNFPDFVRQLFKHFPEPEVFYQLWYGATPSTLDWHDMESLWQQELEKWGGPDAFQTHWQQCRQLPHQYLHCDLLQDRQNLLKALSEYNASYIWWSNAFFTIYSHWHYSAAERKAHYLDWITELSNSAPNCQINGADHNNIAVNSLSAQQYFQVFNQQQYDQLTPQKHHHIEMLF